MKQVLTLLIIFMLSSSVANVLAADENASGHSIPLQAQVGAFGVLTDQMQAKMGFTCTTTTDEDVKVATVRTGTPAFISGLKEGDHIIDAQLKGDSLIITIERKGKVFDARLIELAKAKDKPPVLLAQKAKLDTIPTLSFNLKLEQVATMPENQLIQEKARTDAVKRAQAESNSFSLKVQKNVQLLAKFDMQLLVDRSSSMHKPDCPDDMPRWNWVGEQAEEISRALAPYNPNGLTIVPFATEYDVFEHAKPQDIAYLFRNIGLQGGTRLFEPLAERLDDYFAHYKSGGKPLLIVVITDGCPSPKFEPALVKQALVEASQKMTYPQEVTVIFFQIGDEDRFGQRFLTDLDQNLVDQGARYHFVHTILFDDFADFGLGPALVAAIRRYAPQPQAPAPVKASNPAKKATGRTSTLSKTGTKAASGRH